MTFRFVFTIILTFVFVSCNSDDINDGALLELNRNRQIWQSAQVKNYSWNERLSCFCGGVLERDIFVVNGIKDRVEFDETTLSTGQTYDDVFMDTKTVEEAFNFIESLLRRELASLLVEYDTTYGFPKVISIDYAQGLSDDEIAFSYADFSEEN